MGRSNMDATRAPSTAYMEALVIQMSDPHPLVRGSAAAAMGKLGVAAAPHAAALASLTSDGDHHVRRHAQIALKKVGATGAEALAERLSHTDSEARRSAAMAMGHMGVLAAPHARAVAGRLKDGDEWVRRSAAEVLGKLGKDIVANSGTSEVDPLAKVRHLKLRDSDIAAVGPARECARALADSLGDPDDAVRQTATVSLGRMGPTAAMHSASLADRLGHDSSRLTDRSSIFQRRTHETLRQMHESGIPNKNRPTPRNIMYMVPH